MFLSKMAELCDKAYSEHTFVVDDIECLYRRIDEKHVYAIRGTETQLVTRGGFIDLLRGALFPSHKDNDMHYGFYNGWRQIGREITDHFKAVSQKRDYPMVLTGHSMGGSIALIGTIELIRDGFISPDSISCVTFGAPKCVDFDDTEIEAIQDRLKPSVMEIVHYLDPVPYFFGFMGYDHLDPSYIGHEMYEQAPWYKRKFKYHSMDVYRGTLKAKGF